jgi:hypothetical protein
VREIDVDAVLFEKVFLLRNPEIKRVGGDDAVNGGGLEERTFGGVTVPA